MSNDSKTVQVPLIALKQHWHQPLDGDAIHAAFLPGLATVAREDTPERLAAKLTDEYHAQWGNHKAGWLWVANHDSVRRMAEQSDVHAALLLPLVDALQPSDGRDKDHALHVMEDHFAMLRRERRELILERDNVVELRIDRDRYERAGGDAGAAVDQALRSWLDDLAHSVEEVPPNSDHHGQPGYYIVDAHNTGTGIRNIKALDMHELEYVDKAMQANCDAVTFRMGSPSASHDVERACVYDLDTARRVYRDYLGRNNPNQTRLADRRDFGVKMTDSGIVDIEGATAPAIRRSYGQTR